MMLLERWQMKDFWLNSEGRLQEGWSEGDILRENVMTGRPEEVIEIIQRGCVATVCGNFPFSSVEKALEKALKKISSNSKD